MNITSINKFHLILKELHMRKKAQCLLAERFFLTFMNCPSLTWTIMSYCSFKTFFLHLLIFSENCYFDFLMFEIW